MRLSDNFVIRDLSGVTVLLPLSGAFQGIMAVNPVGTRILELIQSGVAGESALLSALCGEYDAPPDEIEKDARSFLSSLRENGILLDESPDTGLPL